MPVHDGGRAVPAVLSFRLGMTPDLLETYARTVTRTGAGVGAVTTDQLRRPTPCPEWDVEALLDHVVAGLISYTMIAVDGRIDFDRLRADPDPVADRAARWAGAYDAAAAAALEAWRHPGVLDEPCRHPLGRMRRGDALALHHADLLLHAWDLAVATGRDEAIDPAAAILALEALRTITPVTEELRWGGYWGIELACGPSADVTEQLLAFSGRAIRAPR
jgi:uncharacterized protein (TIGR03086 family)